MLRSKKKKREALSDESEDLSLEGVLKDKDLEEKVLSEVYDEKTEDVPSEIFDNDEIRRLKDDIEALRAELEAKKKESERIFSELAEFAVNFPKRTMECIPNEVWERVKNGISLSDAYSHYEKKREADESVINELNRINAERSSGAISSAADGGYYSPDEVKKMTANEVKKNYNLIIESMKKWN